MDRTRRTDRKILLGISCAVILCAVVGLVLKLVAGGVGEGAPIAIGDGEATLAANGSGEGMSIAAVGGEKSSVMAGDNEATPAATSNEAALQETIANIMSVVGWCLFAGVSEELLFCGIVFTLLERLLRWIQGKLGGEFNGKFSGKLNGKPNSKFRSRINSKIMVAVITAVLFGLAHISTGLSLGAGISAEASMSLSRTLDMGIVAAVAKVIQATAFGFCMCTLYLRTRNLVWPMVTHFAFDLIYLGVPMILVGVTPESFATLAQPTDTFASLVVVMVLLVFVAMFAAREVITCKSFPTSGLSDAKS